MGRPPGSKNKPKITLVKKAPNKKVPLIVSKPKAVKPAKEEPKHIFYQFLDYVMERMDGIEMSYYQRAAKRKGITTRLYVAQSVIAFFRLHDNLVTDNLKNNE